MFDPCPRCRRFVTRFEPKFQFTLDEEYLKHTSKRDFAKWNGVKVCIRCLRVLENKEFRCRLGLWLKEASECPKKYMIVKGELMPDLEGCDGEGASE